jgi:hypothetical protein
MAESDNAGAQRVEVVVEAEVVAALPRFGALVDVLRHRCEAADRFIRQMLAPVLTPARKQWTPSSADWRRPPQPTL